MKLFVSRLRPLVRTVTEDPEHPGSFHISFAMDFEATLLIHPLCPIKTKAQAVMFFLRGFIEHGISESVFQDVYFSH